jgi:homoserine O-acetyltransferase
MTSATSSDASIVRTQSVTPFSGSRPFTLESGGILAPVTVAYESYGSLNAARDNAILVCHALTGSAHAAGLSSPDEKSAGWWDPMIGPGRPLDTSQYCVICSNFLGGCYGTTGPTSLDPRTDKPYGMAFPEYTVRDMVRLQKALMDHLGVTRLRTVTGGSLGGMQVLEWPLLYPAMVSTIIPIATATQHSPWCIGLNDLARQAIMLDPAWQGGAYAPDAQPGRGLSIAREIAMMSYRSDVSFLNRFGRERVESSRSSARSELPDSSGSPVPSNSSGASLPLRDPRFQVERYLRYQGKKLVDRFDANTYLYITLAMDSHDVAAGRSDLTAVLGSLRQPALCVGISSDILYPAHEQRAIAAALPNAHYRELDAPHGHDSFLIAYDLLGPMVRDFLQEFA